jgi:peptidoglycan hydrolase-like protein with peptidoglycan-binding domain
MRPVESFIAQPIRSLQTMLRVIAEDEGRMPSVIPDGFYGQQTMAEVSAHQRKHGLPVTGIADQRTWESVVESYEPALIRVSEARPVDIILNPGQTIRKGEQNPNLYLAQSMLLVLSQTYTSILPPNHTGILDTATAESLESFQQLSGLPVTGELDKITWYHMVLHYPLATNLHLSPG